MRQAIVGTRIAPRGSRGRDYPFVCGSPASSTTGTHVVLMTDNANTANPDGESDVAPMTPVDETDEGGEIPRDTAAADVALILETRRAQSEAAVNEQREKYLRLAAEFDNFRKRAAREREGAAQHGQSVVIRGLLEALDDLARFAHLDPWKTEIETVIDGARMVEQKLLKSLSGHGLELINPLGETFDPNFHEAVSTAPASSEDEDHTVSEVYQVGYVFKGLLLRPARVVVKQWTA
jgi:molecular chaperone GrpE